MSSEHDDQKSDLDDIDSTHNTDASQRVEELPVGEEVSIEQEASGNDTQDKEGEESERVEQNTPETDGVGEQAQSQSEKQKEEEARALLEDATNYINENVTLDHECKREAREGETPMDIRRAISLLRLSSKELDTVLDEMPKLNISSSEEYQKWAEAILQGAHHHIKTDALLDSLTRKNSQWRQIVEEQGERLVASRPRFSGGDSNHKLSGDKAVMKIRSMMNLGATVQIPLWHTGIWVTIKAPSEGDLLDLARNLMEEKIQIGRATTGAIYANTSVYMASHLINFIFDHVYDNSLKEFNPQELKNIIDVTDYHTLVWGLALSIWPNGYNLMEPCVNKVEGCTHVTEETLNVSKISWTDTASLSDWQRKQMVRRRAKFTEDEVKRYKDEFNTASEKRIVNISDDITLVLRVPTLADYENSGFSWVEGIVRSTDEAFSQKLSFTQRQQHIQDKANLTTLRMYAHWIDRLIVRENVDDGEEQSESYVEDRETLEDIIGELSSSNKTIEKVLEAVGEFIDEVTVSLIAIPRYRCPMCGADQGAKDPDHIEENVHPYLIPLDAPRIFFTQLGQHLFQDPLFLQPGQNNG